jgi:hypothetical protein
MPYDANRALQVARESISGRGADKTNPLLSSRDTVEDHNIGSLVDLTEEEIPDLIKNNPY